MTAEVNQTDHNYSLEQLAALTVLPLRTVRYYIQKGLVARPNGSTRGAVYDLRHFETLLRIKQWTDAGLSLARISALLTAPQLPVVLPKSPGGVEVRSHIHLQDGVELVIAPDRAGLNPEQVRELTRVVLDTLASLRDAVDSPPAPGANSTRSADP